jgi:hypothetical protein
MKNTVQKLFKSGISQANICKTTNIPRSTVSRWVKEIVQFSDFQRLRKKNANIEEKLASRYIPEPNSGCWIWLGNIKKNGYGSLTVGEKNLYAHRLSYEISNGPIPKGKVLDHKCRVRCCCNPDHLEPVTQHENVLRGKRWREKGGQ